MVPDPRAKMGTDQLRPVNRPQSVRILTNGERPVVLIAGRHRYRIEQV
jgi:hypothetical protein